MARTRPLPRHRPSARLRRAVALATVVAAGLVVVVPGAGAQEPPTAPPPGAPAVDPDEAPDTLAVPRPAGGVSPRGAFLRAVALPGWGHASIGAYHRGAFYFVTEGAAAWTLIRTRRRHDEARERARFREDLLRASLAAEGITDPAELRARLDADPTLQDLDGLVEARRQQREDWTAVTLFLVLLSGVDAFVSAHLGGFPAPLDLNAAPAGDGRVELSVGIRLPR